MKRATASLLLLSLFAVLIACNKDENPIVKEDTVESTMKQGSWQVTQIQDLGTYYSRQFKGRTFVFNADGSATSTDSLGQTVRGSWYINSQGDMGVKISFGNANPENRLNRTFKVRDFSKYKFRLYTNGATASATYVTFER
jgi:hypothetical protein